MKASGLSSELVIKENYRLFVVINFISYLGILAHLAFIILFFWININFLAYFNFFSVSVWLYSYALNRAGKHSKAMIALSLEVILHAVIATYFMGWDSGFHYYFLPFILFLFINHKQSLLSIVAESAAVLSMYLWLLMHTRGSAYQNLIDADVINGFQFMNIGVNFLAIGLLGYALRTSSMRAEWEMEQLASTDSLTGLYNRRKMYEMLEQERIRLQRSEKPFVLVISDIDYFKAINDQYGHECGDYVLREISLLMQSALRKQDIVSRWGGEEFILLLPETDGPGAKTVIETLRKQVASRLFEYETHRFSITMTFGMALFDGSQPIANVIGEADKLLYRGKQQGRNCIMTSEYLNPAF
ncbi:MAG: GGDEF domain-containing protein [Gammaproteobacteria bacterium]|nr:GGDEF domain-containing protein [Gammaproteobacteria bacterium]